MEAQIIHLGQDVFVLSLALELAVTFLNCLEIAVYRLLAVYSRILRIFDK